LLVLIRESGQATSAERLEAQLLLDATHAVNFTTQFFQQRPLLRLEWELVENRRLSNFEWNQLQLQALLNARFYTAFAKVQYEPLVGQNILVQKEKVEKNKLNKKGLPTEEGALLRTFQGLERKLPSSAIQTFFRTNYRNHINLSAIADNKANIMISVNAILISVVISILSYKNVSETNPMVLLPVVIFLVTGLTSLIFAVLSIRPKVTSLNQNAQSLEEAKQNIVFFGNFIHLKLEQYEEAMDAVFRDGELLYGNMTRDIYHMGKVLDKKYRFLTMSYNIFMIGFISTVITFLIAIFA
ncbi:MAG: Pycsar system effector family protein, partial [Bacteroidota bacterium]